MARTTKAQILALLGGIQRPGVYRLIAFLDSSDFFTAPASTMFHAAYPGGLAHHSISTLFTQKVPPRSSKLGSGIVVPGLDQDLKSETVAPA